MPIYGYLMCGEYRSIDIHNRHNHKCLTKRKILKMQLSIIIYDINGQFQMNICSTGLLMKYLYNARNGNTNPVKV